MPMNRRSTLAFLAPLILGPIGLLVFACLVVPTQWDTRLGGDYWMIGLGYGGELHHADCEIVTFGDSTGMVAINPAQLTAQTGLSACNISQVGGMQILNGQIILDRYLSQNAAPKYLVMVQAPDAFDPYAGRGHGIGEAITYLMRQPDHKRRIVTAITHAPDMFVWVSVGIDSILRNLRGRHFTAEEMSVRERHGGQLLIEDPVATRCDAAPALAGPNRGWVQSIRSRYGRDGSRVLIDSMAVPDCDPDIAHYRSTLDGVTDNKVETLPLNDFYVGGRHVDDAGSKAFTAMVAAQICKYEHSKTCGAS